MLFSQRTGIWIAGFIAHVALAIVLNALVTIWFSLNDDPLEILLKISKTGSQIQWYSSDVPHAVARMVLVGTAYPRVSNSFRSR